MHQRYSKTDRHTGQDRTDSIGRTVLQTVAETAVLRDACY